MRTLRQELCRTQTRERKAKTAINNIVLYYHPDEVHEECVVQLPLLVRVARK